MKRYMIVMGSMENCYRFMKSKQLHPSECILIPTPWNMREKMLGYYNQVMNGEIELFGISKEDFAKIYLGDSKAFEKEYEEIKKEYYKTRAYFDNTHDNMNNVWHFARTGNEERVDTGGHATPKPLALCERAILSSSRKGEIVLDLFGGSGSTLIASERNGRKCRMIELSENYCDVIRRRYTKFAKDNGLKITSGCLE